MEIFALLLLSFFAVSILLVPFINILYKIKFQRQKQVTRDIFEVRTPIFDKLHSHKVGTPVGGGALIIAVVTILYLVIVNSLTIFGVTSTSLYPFQKEIQVLLFTFIAFGALGFYDDARKTFGFKRTKFWGMRFRYKFLLQWAIALAISSMMYFSWRVDYIQNDHYIQTMGLLFS